jgi:hypothetical protein
MTIFSPKRWQAGILLISTICLWASASAADNALPSAYTLPDRPQHSRVDIALVLAVDVSSSIEMNERLFQRQAYAEALKDPRVARIALGGETGSVAIAYMEWSGARFQRVHLPIRVMSTAGDLAAFADDILAIPDVAHDPMYLQATAVGDALLAAEVAISALDIPARDYVIDISGDGVLNDGLGLQPAREHVLSRGLTVNGLPIELVNNPAGYSGETADTVSRFYADCVIGGPGAFHLVARGFEDIRETLIMKLMLEMAQMQPEQKREIALAWNAGRAPAVARLIPAMVLDLSPAPSAPDPVDCGNDRQNARNPFVIIP